MDSEGSTNWVGGGGGGLRSKAPNGRSATRSWRSYCSKPASRAMQTGRHLLHQDMGAFGSASHLIPCEMGGRGPGVGSEIELDSVPQRENRMSAYEIMLRESAARHWLLVAKQAASRKSTKFSKMWGGSRRS